MAGEKKYYIVMVINRFPSFRSFHLASVYSGVTTVKLHHYVCVCGNKLVVRFTSANFMKV